MIAMYAFMLCDFRKHFSNIILQNGRVASVVKYVAYIFKHLFVYMFFFEQWAPCHAVVAMPLLVAFELLLCIHLESIYGKGLVIFSSSQDLRMN